MPRVENQDSIERASRAESPAAMPKLQLALDSRLSSSRPSCYLLSQQMIVNIIGVVRSRRHLHRARLSVSISSRLW